MSQENGNGWKGWALALVSGLLVGVLGAGGVGAYQRGKIESRLEQKIREQAARLESDIDGVHIKEQKNFDIILGPDGRP